MNTNITENNQFVEVLNSITRKEFVTIWKKVSNDKRIKPVLIEHKYGNTTYKTKEKGWIYPEHHIIYNIVRGLPFDRGFKPDSDGLIDAIDNLKKLNSSGFENRLFKPFEEFMSLNKFKEILLEIQIVLNTK